MKTNVNSSAFELETLVWIIYTFCIGGLLDLVRSVDLRLQADISRHLSGSSNLFKSHLLGV